MIRRRRGGTKTVNRTHRSRCAMYFYQRDGCPVETHKSQSLPAIFLLILLPRFAGTSHRIESLSTRRDAGL